MKNKVLTFNEFLTEETTRFKNTKESEEINEKINVDKTMRTFQTIISNLQSFKWFKEDSDYKKNVTELQKIFFELNKDLK